jgi:hypothetical protein
MPRLWMFAVAAAAFAQPTPDQQRDFIAGMRKWALEYNDRLPNFICTQVTHRSVDYSGTGDRWQSMDTIEQQLSYFDRRERYQIVSINGQRSKKQPQSGVSSNGEFGSMLNQIFDPSIGTQFLWERMDTLRGRPVWVFSLRVDVAHSRATLAVANHVVVAGYHGFVFADAESRMVMRLSVDADAPQSFPMRDISHVIDYGQVPLAGDEFTLPVHSEMRSNIPESLLRSGVGQLFGRRILTRNEVDFVLYRKYASDSAIKFESDPPKK